jgi:hypothetical protein
LWAASWPPQQQKQISTDVNERKRYYSSAAIYKFTGNSSFRHHLQYGGDTLKAIKLPF